MRRYSLPGLLLIGLSLTALSRPPGDVPLHDFEEIGVWQPHRDGGRVVQTSADMAFARSGSAMRLRYTDGPPQWGNLVAPCRVPPNGTALRFWLYKHRSAPQAAMYIWLLEADGDAWVQQIQIGGQALGALPPGWYEARLPVGGFHFEARGRRTREMPAVDRMLIGCNFGDLEVTVDSMGWETQTSSSVAPLPRTEGLRIEQGRQGSVGVLDMGEGLPDGFRCAHPPQRIADALREGGFGVTLLKPGDFADPQVLHRRNFEAVVLPCGPFFPAAARAAFLAYLKSGGSFLSTDGYAFDRPVVWNGEGWDEQAAGITAEQMGQTASERTPMNTRSGTPGDAVTFRPEQIGVFDPAFLLEDVHALRPVGIWAERMPTLEYRIEKPMTGFSACGLIGDNNPVFPPVYRRWVPVLEAQDEDGAPRGAALSLMYNFAGVYRGSGWAFSGITSGEDLFLQTQARKRLLWRVMDEITRKVFLHSLTTDLACYRPGETANIRVEVSNFGDRPMDACASSASTVKVVLRVAGRRIADHTLTLEPGQTAVVEGRIAVNALGKDFCPVRAELLRGGRRTDAMTGGFCVWNEKVIAGGLKIGWKDNYLSVNGRPAFLAGTNQTGMMFYSALENPTVWDADFRRMAAYDVRILRILHFSPFAKDGYRGGGQHSSLDLANRPERLRRQMDAIVQLAQKHRIALFLSLHDWLGIGLTDAELKAQADWNRFWAARYRNVPGIFYDVQNEPSVDVHDRPDIVALWNEWLRRRYGSDEALRTAWAKHPPEAPLPNVPLGGASNEWDDARAADRKRFEAELLNRWVKANVEGIRAGDPDALVCVGYLPSMPPADKMLGTRYTDFSNMHYYGPLETFPLEFKLIDRRFEGKGFSLGEFGAQEAHDSRVRGQTGLPVEASVRRFQHVLHYAAGLGAAFVANWDWKEFDEMVFPWGLVQRGTPVPKPWLHTLSQGARFLSLVRPVYESLEIFLLAPDSHRIGPRFEELHRALQRSVDLLLDRRVNFGVINEEEIERLPASAKAIIWPLPYCPEDATFARVRGWVEEGGALYLSGDVAFDRTRRPTRRERRAQLGLPDQEPPLSPFETPDSAWQKPVMETQVGRGRVLYAPYPLEMRRRASDGAVYARFVQMAGVKTIRLEPEDASVRALSIPTQEGGRLYTLVRTGGGAEPLAVSLPEYGVSVTLKAGGCAFVLVNKRGEVTAAESEGEISVGGTVLVSAEGHFGVLALDGKALLRSQQILLLPHQNRQIVLGALSGVERGTFTTISPTRGTGKVVASPKIVRFAAGQIGILAAPQMLEGAIRRLGALSNLASRSRR